MRRAPDDVFVTEEIAGFVAGSDAWVDAAAARLRFVGYRDVEAVSPDGRRLRALRRADFRAEWFFTRLHTLVVFDVLESGPATDDQLCCFTKLAMRWAKRAKGGLPRGLQTGIAVLPVLVAAEGTSAASRSEARRRPQKDFSALRLPLLVDLSAGEGFTYDGPITWGLIYRNFLGEQQRVVLRELRGDTMKPDGRGRRWLRVAAVGAAVGAVGLVAIAVAALLLVSR